MRRAILVLTALVFAGTVASARMGETLGQCVARYGPARSQALLIPPLALHLGKTDYVFEKEGLVVAVVMDGDIVGGICYFSVDGGEILPSEQLALLEANASGWQGGSATESRKSWTTSDSGLYASYDPRYGTLVIVSTDLVLKRLQDDTTAPKRLEGF